MKIRWLLQTCIVVAVGMGLASCTKAEIEQAMNRPAEIMLQSSPCQPAGIASTATPEFCVNVTDIQLLRHDTQAEVSLTLMNRTGRRLFIYVSGAPSLTDSGGTKWNGGSNTGLGSGTHYPVTLEPNMETQGSLIFHQSGRSASALTFSLRGEMAIMQVDSRGQPIPYKITVIRGFNISGIRLPQPPPQSSAPTEQNPDTKLAQVSPQGGAPATPKASALPQSSASAAVVGAPGSGNLSNQKPALPNTSSTSGQMAKAIDTPVDDAVTSKSGTKSVGSGGPGPDVIGLRIGSTPAEARAIFKSRVLVSDSLQKSYTEEVATLGFNIPGQGVSGSVPNGKYLKSLTVNVTPHWLFVDFAPVPGHEGIVSLKRDVAFPDDKKPTYDAFEKTVVEKYGTPTVTTPKRFIWSYDTHGTLQQPVKNTDNINWCEVMASNIVYNIKNWVLNLGEPTTGVPLEQVSAKCGAVFLRITTNSPGEGGALVTSHNTIMVGFDAGIRASKVAGAIIDKASADASAAAIKKGQQQKLEF